MNSPPPKSAAATQAAQITYWNGAVGERWANEQEALDAGLRGYGTAALSAGNVKEGEAVLDVGCGAGDTTLDLAKKVGPHGRVVGLDVSAPMLGRARERAKALPNVSFVEGDASRHPLEARSFDLLFSRFGVMFFAEPSAAFAHLRTALRKDGRVSFVCWRTLAENAWAKVTFDAACQVAGPPPPGDKYAPGPFAFGEKGRAVSLLEGAGFSDVQATPLEMRHRLGSKTPPTIDDAVDFSLKLGPAARLLGDATEETKTRARAAIAKVLEPHMTSEGVFLPASVWIVTARNPGDDGPNFR